jgi:hypothetical protein
MKPLSERHEIVTFLEEGLSTEEIAIIMNLTANEVQHIIDEERNYRCTDFEIIL